MEYQPLSFTKSETRLLRLQKNEDESAIVSCSLETISLTKPTPYAALSYHWGDPLVTYGILINRALVQVTINLEAALRHLRMQNVE
jgi:Heterokaryon incompatibility protein (HET)